MKTILLLIGISSSLVLMGQTYILDTNSVSATLQTKGVLFNNFDNVVAGFEALNGDGTNTIFSTSLWMAGKDVNNQIRGSIGLYGQNSESYITGPLTVLPGTDTTAPEPYGAADITPSVAQDYNQIFTITAYEISKFRSWHNCVNDPSCDENLIFPNYTIPASIINWPAHGDLNQDQDFFLSPYYDIDGDNVYNPLAGDYPCIKGDKYALIILNDQNPNNTTIDPVGIEIHVEVYAYDRNQSSPVDRTVFVGYDIINRSTLVLKDFYVGVFADLDIGCPTDDFIGSIPELNSFFGYNSAEPDNDCFTNIGYGSTPPAQGVVFLNQTMSSSISFKTGSTGYSSTPTNSTEYYNCLQGKFKDGSTLYYGGDGHSGSSGVTTTPTNYQYPENAPPGFQPWTEYTQGNPGGDRIILGNIGRDTLRPGQVIELDLAYLFSRADSGDQFASIQTLQNEIPIIQQFYDDSIAACFAGDLSLTISENTILSQQIYPNPASAIACIPITSSARQSGSLKMYDVLGNHIKTIFEGEFPQGESNYFIHADQYASGVYMIVFETKTGKQSQQLMIK